MKRIIEMLLIIAFAIGMGIGVGELLAYLFKY